MHLQFDKSTLGKSPKAAAIAVSTAGTPVAGAHGMPVRLPHPRLGHLPFGLSAGLRPDLNLTAAAQRIGESVAARARAQLLLRRADRVGLRARCFGAVDLENRGAIRIGDDFVLGGLEAVRIAASGGGLIGIGDEVTVESGTSIVARSLVSVGHRVRIGPFCVISDTPLQGRHDHAPRGIMVGDDVWIGAGVTLMPGVRVGSRAVIAAASVVDTDVPDDGLVAGRPARSVRVARRDSDLPRIGAAMRSHDARLERL
jgi:acetyltransferase-like isoleucine patch superfamily enzyme